MFMIGMSLFFQLHSNHSLTHGQSLLKVRHSMTRDNLIKVNVGISIDTDFGSLGYVL